MTSEAAQPSVIDVLRQRRTAASRPGARTDDFRVALSIEGGGNRATYSAGMALAIDEAGFTDAFDHVYGTSGGALNAAWLLSGEGSQWLSSWAWPEVVGSGVTNPRRLLRGGPIVDLHRLVHHVYEQITPMNFAAILANPIGFHPLATDAATGESTDLAPFIADRASLQVALRATACLPLLAGRPVRLGGRRFFDGGLTEAVPFRTPVSDGVTHLLVLRTRRDDQPTVAASRIERVVLAPYFLRHGRAAGTAHGNRHERQAVDEQRLADGSAAEGPQVLQVRPPLGAPDVPRLGGELAVINEGFEVGRSTMKALLTD